MEFLCWFSVGLAAFLLTFTFNDEIALYRYGANTWPAVIAIALMICIAILFIYSSVSRKLERDAKATEDIPATVNLWGTFAAPILYVILIPYIGFYVASVLFVPAYSYIMGKMPFLRCICVSVPAVLLLIVIFTHFLFVPFPVGTINFFYLINSEVVNLLY